jgi:acylphosphatase
MSAQANVTHQRREVYFSGRVQGVGFRFTTRAIAGRYPVVGFVENLSDGRVCLVVEGNAKAIDAFVGAIEAEMARYITSTDSRTMPASGEFANFQVRH